MSADTQDFWTNYTGYRRYNIKRHSTEEDVVDDLRKELSPYFRIHARPQLQGRLCTGRRLRADLVLQPLQPWGGRHTHHSYAPFTLEVKRDQNIADITKALGQAADYAHGIWDTTQLADAGWVDLPSDGRMLSCITWLDTVGYCDPTQTCDRMWIDRIAGRLNVMVLVHTQWSGWELNMSGNTQWCQDRGMANSAFNARVKDGSR